MTIFYNIQIHVHCTFKKNSVVLLPFVLVQIGIESQQNYDMEPGNTE